MPQKTSAARLLDQMGIRYELLEYEVDPNDLAAEAVATKIGLPPEHLFKTLVAQGDRHGICMAVCRLEGFIVLGNIRSIAELNFSSNSEISIWDRSWYNRAGV